MSFFEQTIACGLLERLDILCINPTLILNLSLETESLSKELQARYPSAQMRAVNMLHTPEAIETQFSELALKPYSIDLIVANLVLPYLRSIHGVQKFFQHIRLLLKPGGLFLFSTLGPDTFLELEHCIQVINAQEMLTLPLISEKVGWMDLHDIGDWILQTPFSDPVMEREPLKIQYSKPQDLLRDILQSPWSDALPSLSFSTLKTFLRKYRTHYPRSSKEVSLYEATIEVIYGHAWGIEGAESMVTHTSIPIRIDT